MSTPTALRSEAQPWAGSGWRAVEAQHKNATLSLVHGNLQAQATLEDIIESIKPPMPPDASGLHFLLNTPFRYRAPSPAGSRFRSRFDPGVFYGAENIKTACAESGYWRLRFWMDSEGLATKSSSIVMTLFEFHGVARTMIDLTKAPFVTERASWTHPIDYGRTQALAAQAREAGIELIRYESARNSPEGRCLAILDSTVFTSAKEPFRHHQQTWNLFIQPPRLAVWQRTLSSDSYEFKFELPD